MSLDLLFPNFETLIRTPEDVARLNAAILQLAVQGKLVPQDPTDEPASELLKRIRAEKRRLVKEEGGGESQRLPPIADDEIPYNLPSGWRWVRLPEIYHTWGQKKPDERFTYIDVSSIDNAKGVIGDDLTVVEPQDAPSRARKIVRQGTVIYSTVRPYLLNIAIINQDLDYPPIASTAFAVMHPFEGVLAKYLFYYLRSRTFTDFVESQMTGMAYPAINDSKLNQGLFPLPPLAEQRRIVAKVESLFAQTRALEAKLRQAQADIVTVNRAALNRLSVAADDDAFAAAWATVRDAFDLLYDAPRNVTELRQAILQLAVQGKLVPQDPADEPASELLKRIRAEKRRLVKEGKLQSENTLPSISPGEMPFHPPIGWHWVKLNELAEIVSGVTKGRNLVHFDTISLPYLRVANVQRGYLDLSEIKEIEIKADEKSKYLLRNGDLLLTEGGDADKLGRAAIWRGQIKECLHQNHIFRARPHLPELPAEWLMLYTNSAYGRGYFLESSKQTTNLASINSTQLKNCPIILPPVAEQKRILTKVDQLMRQCDALAAGLARAVGQRRALTEAVLHGAFG